MGNIYNIKEENDKALKMYQASLKLCQMKLKGKTSQLMTFKSMDKISMVFNKKGQHASALKYYLKALQIKHDCLGKNDK